MADNGDDRSSSDDLIRKAKEELKHAKDDEGLAVDDESPSDVIASDAAAARKSAAGQNGDDLPSGGEVSVPKETIASSPTEPPQPPFEQPTRPGGLGALLSRIPIWWIIAGVITFGGLAYNFFTEAKRDDSGVVVEAGEVGADEIRVGDCLMEPENVSPEDDFVFETLEAVPCSAPQDMEVYASFVHSAVSYPGDDALFEWGLERCDPAFETFTGVSFENEARFEVTVVTPDSEAWSSGERTIDCLVLNFDGTPLVGSQEDQGLLGFPGLRVSVCYDMLETETYLAFEEVACDEAHDIEHYAATTLPQDEGTQFPGDAWLDDYAVSMCGRQFESYVGREWALSVAPDYVWTYPTEETWSFSDRLVQCFLTEPAQGKLVGSYRS